MNRKSLAVVLLLLACISIDTGAASPHVATAACRVKTRTVAVSSVAVAPVPLAVAIGVPVAEVTPYYYSYSAYSAYTQPQPPAMDLDVLAAKLAEKLAATKSGAGVASSPQPSKLSPPSLIATKCAQCHSGPEPKGKLSLENPAALDCPTRLKAIRAILSEKMPQGGPRLTPDEAGKLLEELVGE